MSDRFQHLLREEAQRIDVPPPPTHAIVTDGRRRRKVRRTQGLIALAASCAVVAGGLVGVNRLLSDDAHGSSPDPATSPSAPSATAVGGPLDVSGSGVGTQPFGTDADEVLAAVAARLGEPDLTLGPQRYVRVPGSDAWLEDADDPLSPSWQYPITSVTCWGVLCLIFGGDEVDTLQLRGWELAKYRRWSGFEKTKDLRAPDVRLAGTGIRFGDSWKRLHAAYPRTVVQGGRRSVGGRPEHPVDRGVRWCRQLASLGSVGLLPPDPGAGRRGSDPALWRRRSATRLLLTGHAAKGRISASVPMEVRHAGKRAEHECRGCQAGPGARARSAGVRTRDKAEPRHALARRRALV